MDMFLKRGGPPQAEPVQVLRDEFQQSDPTRAMAPADPPVGQEAEEEDSDTGDPGPV